MILITLNTGTSKEIHKEDLVPEFLESLKKLESGDKLPVHGFNLILHRLEDAGKGIAGWTLINGFGGRVWLAAIQCWDRAASSRAWESAEQAFFMVSDENPEVFPADVELAHEPATVPWVALVHFPALAVMETTTLKKVEEIAVHLAFAVMEGG